jgi:hypothetical protein
VAGPGAKDVTEGTASGLSDVRSGSLCVLYINGVAKVVGPVILAFKNCPDKNLEMYLVKLDCLKCRRQELPLH